jgi:hypothetical protein
MEPSTGQLAEIQSRLDNPPRMWTPRGVPVGADADKCILDESVAGVVQSVTDQEDDYGGHRLVVLIREDRSRVSVRGFGAILQSFFSAVEVGDMIGISFEGMATPKTDGYNDYPVYRVERIVADRSTPPEPYPAEPYHDELTSESEDPGAVG